MFFTFFQTTILIYLKLIIKIHPILHTPELTSSANFSISIASSVLSVTCSEISVIFSALSEDTGVDTTNTGASNNENVTKGTNTHLNLFIAFHSLFY